MSCLGDWLSKAPVCSFLIILFLCLFPITSSASGVTISWAENDSPVDGYLIFLRSEGRTYDYMAPDWSGVETSCTLEDLEDSVYYFTIRAYSDEEESEDSDEVKVTISNSTVYVGANE